MKNNKKGPMIIILVAVLAIVIIAAVVISFNEITYSNKQKPADRQDNLSTSQNLSDTSAIQQNTDKAESNETTQTTDNINSRTVNTDEETTIETAMDIALKNSGIAKESLIYLSAHEERNKNTTYYEVAFSDSAYEYEYEIDLNSNILSYEKEPFEQKNHSKIMTAVDSEYIGVDNAKNAARKDSSVSAQDIGYIKVTLEKDNGICIYAVEFKTASEKYEYKINAVSGEITDHSVKAVKK